MSQVEETIMMLNVFKSDKDLPQKVIDNYDLAIKALNKLIPMKPEYKKKDYGGCGDCGDLINRQENCCSNCGQEIDWR